MTQNHSASEASPTLGAEVAEELQREILSGVFMPGSPLREIPLAERYNASRQTIREALRSLADLGLVEVYARRGAIIPVLSPKRAQEIYSMRALMESFAIRNALIEGKIGAAEQENIERAFEQIRICTTQKDIPAVIEADMNFHWAICSPCGHQLLLETLHRLQISTRQTFVNMKLYDSDDDSEVEMHTPILLAVQRRDVDGAARAVHEHIHTNGEKLLIKLMEQESAPHSR